MWVWALGSAVLAGLGGIATTVLSGKIVVPTFAYNDVKAARDAAEAEVRSLNEMIRTEFAPALARNTDVVEKQSAEILRLQTLQQARRRNP